MGWSSALQGHAGPLGCTAVPECLQPPTRTCVLVQRDVAQVARLLHLAAGDALRTQVPQHKVVVWEPEGSSGCKAWVLNPKSLLAALHPLHPAPCHRLCPKHCSPAARQAMADASPSPVPPVTSL